MLDIEKLSHNLGFEEEDVMMLIELYLEGIETSMANIEDSLELNDMQKIKKEAHAIKGSSANLLLADIVKVAKQIEDAAKMGSKTKIYLKLNELDEYVQELASVGYEYA